MGLSAKLNIRSPTYTQDAVTRTASSVRGWAENPSSRRPSYGALCHSPGIRRRLQGHAGDWHGAAQPLHDPQLSSALPFASPFSFPRDNDPMMSDAARRVLSCFWRIYFLATGQSGFCLEAPDSSQARWRNCLALHFVLGCCHPGSYPQREVLLVICLAAITWWLGLHRIVARTNLSRFNREQSPTAIEAGL